MRISQGIDSRTVTALFGLLLTLMGAWLAWSVLHVNIDSEDGYATVTNALFHLGLSENYYAYRPPLMSIFLIPAELIKARLQVHAMDMRVAHAFMAVVNFAYLVGTWMMLARVYGKDFSVLMAYAAAMVTPVFFSYAPFLNFDIFPGLLALWMVRLAALQLQSPSPRIWLTMVVTGSALALIKQNFALVWVGIIAILPIILLSRGKEKHWRRAATGLVVGAAVSGALTWIGYGLALAPSMSGEPLLIRPWLQMTLISSNYASEGGAWQAFYPWVYAKNLSAYGMLAMLLVPPGLILALSRGSLFERMVGLFWLFLVIALHLTPYKEVRYLALLAPFNAVLMVPVLRLIWRRRAIYQWLAIAVLGAGLVPATVEAVRIRDPYYALAISSFLDPLPRPKDFSGKLIFSKPLSFVTPENNAYFGDRYHRIMHLTLAPIVTFYGYSRDQYIQVDDVRNISADWVSPGDIGLLASGALARVAPFVRGNRQGLAQDFVQILGIAETIALQRELGGYRIVGANDHSQYMIVATLTDTLPSMVRGQVDEAEIVRLFGWDKLPDGAEVIAFRILSRCSLIGCISNQSPASSTDTSTHGR